ncbi:MAG: aldehyde dehydrogenase family protein [Burkholderiaceae bacterium]|nr:aldehyde dehydrogenase family protein [Burkholderiaceae bacterium]
MNSTNGQSAQGRPQVVWSHDLLIGAASEAGQGETLTVVNPATEKVAAQLQGASLAQVDAAVRAARTAFASAQWADGAFRRQCLHRLADLIEKNAQMLMASLVEEIATPVSHKGMQIDAALAFLRWFADAALKDRSYSLPRLPGMVGTENTVTFRPAGVVAGIIAYNYPLILVATKLGAAAAAGCTTVLLPSPLAPMTVLLLGKLIREAGFPPGTVNIVVGGPEVGKALSEHPDVDKVSFTGSVGVGRRIMEQAAKGLKGVVLELGGKSAAILMPGVDFAKYTLKLHSRYLQNAGQGCGSPTRILVERKRLDEFLDESRKAYQQIRVGDPWDPATLVGPVISAAHRARVRGYIDEAVKGGAQVAASSSTPLPTTGWYVAPTLISGIDNKARIAREEIFGPVGVVIPYDSIDQAIDITNDSELGLKAYLYGPAAVCKSLAPRLRVGTVVINSGAGLRADAPMGGFKASGIGREWGEEGVREFLETQHIDAAEVD